MAAAALLVIIAAAANVSPHVAAAGPSGVRDYSVGIANAVAKYDACGINGARPCFADGLRNSLAPWMPAAGGHTQGISKRLILETRAIRDAERLTFYQIIDGRLYRNNSGCAPKPQTPRVNANNCLFRLRPARVCIGRVSYGEPCLWQI